MLLQRLRHSEPALETAIAYNLVDLALPASSEVLLDIAKSYSHLSASAMTADPASERHNSVCGLCSLFTSVD
jgi:phosphatidylinositol 4-kinase A